MNDHPAPGRRGSLPGLALVVGLLAFLVADGRSGGTAPVIVFALAAGTTIVLVLLLTAGDVARRRLSRRSRFATTGTEDVRHRESRPLLDLDAGLLPLASRSTTRLIGPVRHQIFVRALDELLAVVDAQPRLQETVEDELFAVSKLDVTGRTYVLGQLSTLTAASPIAFEVEQFSAVARGADAEQLNYLEKIMRARWALR